MSRTGCKRYPYLGLESCDERSEREVALDRRTLAESEHNRPYRSASMDRRPLRVIGVVEVEHVRHEPVD
jgi:hypothetical protein